MEKANIVVDVLSRKSVTSLVALVITQKQILLNFEKLGIEVVKGKIKAYVTYLSAKLTLMEWIKKEKTNELLKKIIEKVSAGEKHRFIVFDDEVLHFEGKLCVPNNKVIKHNILT